MGYDDGFGFEDDDERNAGPKALRDALKAANKRLAELEAANVKALGQLAERNLKDVLEDKGLRPGLAKWIAKDEVDTSDPKAIEAWLVENQEEFNFSLADASSNAAGDGEQDSEQESEYEAGFARMQAGERNPLPADRVSEGHAQIKGAKSTAEIQAALDRALSNRG